MSDIQILIDIRNSKEILAALTKVFKSNSDWIIDFNAHADNEHWTKYPNETAKYFIIDLEDMRFAWATHDDDETTRGLYQIVNTVEDAISIAEFAIANALEFRCDPNKPFVPAVHPSPEVVNDDLPSSINIKKLKELIKLDSVISFKQAPSNNSFHHYIDETPYSFFEEYNKLEKIPTTKPYIKSAYSDELGSMSQSAAKKTYKQYEEDIVQYLNKIQAKTF